MGECWAGWFAALCPEPGTILFMGIHDGPQIMT
jgi:hypothetical protein